MTDREAGPASGTMRFMSRFSRCLAFLVIAQAILALAHAQTMTVILANLAASYVGKYTTVEGVVAKVFTSKTGNTFLNTGAGYLTRLSPAGSRAHHR